MRRVAVVGSGGAGKSTFAKQLGRSSGLPVFHLDELHWLPGWIEPANDEWHEKLRALAAKEQWIIDGNYGNSFDLRFDRADTVIVLALPRRVCIPRVLNRMVRNWHQPTQAPGCPEHLDFKFLRWLWRFPYDSRPRIDEALARHHGRISLIELKTKREVRRYLAFLDPSEHSTTELSGP